MTDGTFTIFVLQHRTIAKSPWLKPDEPLIPEPDQEWTFSSNDFFGQKTNWDVWCKTGKSGWWTVEEAKEQLSHVRFRDKNGDYDSFDTYGKRHQACRHQFRIVKLELSQKTTVV